jgi:hypothetical protein
MGGTLRAAEHRGVSGRTAAERHSEPQASACAGRPRATVELETGSGTGAATAGVSAGSEGVEKSLQCVLKPRQGRFHRIAHGLSRGHSYPTPREPWKGRCDLHQLFAGHPIRSQQRLADPAEFEPPLPGRDSGWTVDPRLKPWAIRWTRPIRGSVSVADRFLDTFSRLRLRVALCGGVAIGGVEAICGGVALRRRVAIRLPATGAAL